MKIATFRFDATPPQGHGCCGGWITPVESVADALEAVGMILQPDGEPPVVLCVLDWTGLANDAYADLQAAVAAAAGTTAQRVTLHVLHPHNAPMACSATERLLLDLAGRPLAFGEHPLLLPWFEEIIGVAAAATTEAMGRLQPCTHVACGMAEAKEVASNRRVGIGPDGVIDRSDSPSHLHPAGASS